MGLMFLHIWILSINWLNICRRITIYIFFLLCLTYLLLSQAICMSETDDLNFYSLYLLLIMCVCLTKWQIRRAGTTAISVWRVWDRDSGKLWYRLKDDFHSFSSMVVKFAKPKSWRSCGFSPNFTKTNAKIVIILV